ncbi:MAG: chalcone isomerase family protein [Piscinibacter sp.]|nr:chalcone isomerase family protein [Piscinibacter sp.]
MRRRCLLALALAPTAGWAQRSVPPEVRAELPGARLRGSGALTFFGLRVYDARLWVRGDFEPERFEDSPLALELEYGRALVGRLIAERSLQEMQRSGAIAEPQAERWLAAMQRAFPDVQAGDRITGVYRPQESARFFVNGALRAELRDAEFARRFFGIWLAPQTSEPALREALLGAARPLS